MSEFDEGRDLEVTLGRVRSLIDQDFSVEQLDALRKQLRETEERMARLRQFPLENGDQPAPGFRPFRKGAKGS